MASSSLPTQAQLLLPLLGALDAGVSRPREVADVLADEMGLTPEERQRRVSARPRRGGTSNYWDRTVRFAALRARLHGYFVRPERAVLLLGVDEQGTRREDGLHVVMPLRLPD